MKLAGAESGKVQLVSEPVPVTLVLETGREEKTGRLRWIPPKVEMTAKVAARQFLRMLCGQEPSDEELLAEQRLLMLSWALVEDDGAYKTPVFTFPAILDAQSGRVQPASDLFFAAMNNAPMRLGCPNADELWDAYTHFALLEFPSALSIKDARELIEDAKKKPLLTLLSEHGFWKLQQLLGGMAKILRGSGPGNTPVGRP